MKTGPQLSLTVIRRTINGLFANIYKFAAACIQWSASCSSKK